MLDIGFAHHLYIGPCICGFQCRFLLVLAESVADHFGDGCPVRYYRASVIPLIAEHILQQERIG